MGRRASSASGICHGIPRQPDALLRAVRPDADGVLMAAVGDLDDRFARVAITVLRRRANFLLEHSASCAVDAKPYGRRCGVTAFEGSEGALAPTALVATTVKV